MYVTSKMTVITNNTYDDIQLMIDFFMNDGSGDANLKLNEQGINEKTKIQCIHNPCS